MLALASAVLYGAADFVGGMTSRRADTVAIVLVSQTAGLAMAAVFVLLQTTPLPGLADWVWGGVAGLTGGIGVALLYRALAIGVMAIVAPITAVCAVVVPVAVAVLLGERPIAQEAVGITLAILAIVLVTGASPAEHPDAVSDRWSGVGLAVAAGVAIGFFFLALANTTPGAGLWPLVAARLASVILFSVVAVVTRRAFAMTRAVALAAAAGGVLDMLANLFYLLASRQGPLTVAVTLASLYPASTILLARVVLQERLTTWQWAGVALAMAAIVIIVA